MTPWQGNVLWVIPMVAVALAVYRWGRRDFKAWVSLGEGGLPHNLTGWLAMTALRLLQRDGVQGDALGSVLNGPDDAAYLGQLMRRSGSRPRVPHYPIPQRQENELPHASTLHRLQALFDRHAERLPTLLTWQRSRFERHNRALVLRQPECGWDCAARWGGEVAHIHPSDGSMHMILSPSDAATVLAQGWGELHSLSGRLGLLPASYTFVYAPRNEEDLQAVEAILLAAIGHMSGRSPSSHTALDDGGASGAGRD